ncbi:MAG: beta-propeller domain-containing protein [Acidimicrobiia bacterium]|nr:beta-propeller domain-containing protein [Acidimicrobiia bacterium]
MKRTLVMILATLALVAASCTAAGESTTTTVDGQRSEVPAGTRTVPALLGKAPANAYATPVALQLFDACQPLLDYVISHALERVTPWGLDGGGYGGPVLFGARDGVADVFAAAESDSGQAPVAGVDYSTTNVQEVGVDEPDIIKTDGNRIVALANNVLQVVSLGDDGPEITGTLRFADTWNSELLLSGDTVIVLGTAQTTPGTDVARSGFAPSYYGGTSTITQVDISGDAPQIQSTMFVDGFYTSARMVDGIVRVVIDSFPTGLEFVFPEGSGLRAERDALRQNQEIIRNSSIENWLPYYVIERADGTSEEGLLVDCAATHRPTEFAGLGTLVVLTVDATNDLNAQGSTALFAEGGIVYASSDNLYVATRQWIDWATVQGDAPTTTTQIHKFDISDPAEVTYRGTGQVDGYLLNQFAMSEYDGDLRVASTDSPDWFWTDESSESSVSVLRENAGLLEEIGSIGGLGEGERIFSVRFVDTIGYVVTFRQTDPLYTIDLTDPTAPVAKGELKINGYSAYLHPLSETRLLGVGQDADDEGRIEGAQLSLFDVSDLTSPTRLDTLTVSDANSSVEWDHRAFLFWAADDLAIVPLNRYVWDERNGSEDYFAGALAVRIADTGINEITRITHATDERKWEAQIQRSLVVGDELYTMSQLGIMASDLGTLEKVEFLGWQR